MLTEGDGADLSGTLAVIGTPIGNLGDITKRAVDELASVDVLCCEDTRRTRQLLSYLGVPAPELVVANDHTEIRASERIIERLHQGKRVGLVSDAGMPAVSDPGARIVAAVAEQGFAVTSAPGPSAVTTALALSGFGCERFVFEGFLPRKGAARAERIGQLAQYLMPTVIYEAPHRLRRTLGDLQPVVDGDRPIVVVREATKRFEQVIRGSLTEVIDHFEITEPRGEFVVVVGPAQASPPPNDAAVRQMVRDALGEGRSHRGVAKAVAAATGLPSRHVYEIALEIKREMTDEDGDE